MVQVDAVHLYIAINDLIRNNILMHNAYDHFDDQHNSVDPT